VKTIAGPVSASAFKPTKRKNAPKEPKEPKAKKARKSNDTSSGYADDEQGELPTKFFCKSCNKELLTSSKAKHITSATHLKKAAAMAGAE
jgi:hypothetical protein